MKQLEKSKSIVAKLEAILGKEADLSKYAVFETIAINTLPLSKRGVFDKGVLAPSLIKAMEAAVNKNDGFVPLHTMHRQGSEIPVGRVFEAEMRSYKGKRGKEVTELRCLFYISLGTEIGRTLVDGLDSAVINEVSVGVVPKSVKCSKCDFDYAKDGTFFNWLDRKCANDHKIGDGGTHVILDGLENFAELSLVSLGAADNARVQGRSQAVMAEDEVAERHKLAANDSVDRYSLLVATKTTEPTMTILNASEVSTLRKDLETRGKRAIAAKNTKIADLMAKLDGELSTDAAADLREEFTTALAEFEKANPEVQTPENPDLSMQAFIDLKADNKVAQNTIAAKDTQITDLNTQLTAAQTTIADLNGQVATLAALKADNETMTEFLKLVCQNALVASGMSKPEIPNSATDLISTIKLAQSKLSKLPVGGVALSSEAGTTNTNPQSGHDSGVYKTRK